MNRLKLPLFIGLVIVALMCSCSYAIASAEPDFATVGILAANDGRDAYVAATAEMPYAIILAGMENNSTETRDVAIQWYRVKMETRYIAGTIWGVSPVIIGNDVAVQFNPSGMEANYKFFVKSGDIFGRSGQMFAEKTIIRGQLPVMPGNVGVINSTVISATRSFSMNDGATSTTRAADMVGRNGDMLGRNGGINSNIKAGINPVIKAVIVHGTIEV